MSNSRPPKSQDKSNKIDKIREIVRNTEENLEETEFGMEFLDPVESHIVKEQNRRRKQSIDELKEEIKEELTSHKKD